MRFFKILVFTISAVLFGIIISFLIIPKGLLLIYILHKNKINIVAEKIEETFLGAKFYGIHTKVKGIEVNIPYIVWSLNEMSIPCESGKAVLKYEPLSTIVLKVKDFSGSCIGTKEFEKISGEVIFNLDKGFSGKLKVFNPDAELNFKEKYVFIRVPGLGFIHKIKIF